jgi:CBS domain-containing protein
MARFIREIMNPELFTLTPDVRADDALRAILELGITAAPVVDGEQRPIGVTSIRDFLRDGLPAPVSSPAVSVPGDATVEEAARIMTESGRHHLVVVGGDGRAVGMLSSLDLLRALIGLPAAYPATFPHYDATLGVAWSNRIPFDADHVAAAPEGAGVLVLSAGGIGRTECDLWVESSAALRPRLVELLQGPACDEASLASILARRDLRFRCAATTDVRLRNSVARRLRDRIDGAPLPRDAVRA